MDFNQTCTEKLLEEDSCRCPLDLSWSDSPMGDMGVNALLSKLLKLYTFIGINLPVVWQ